MTLRKCKDGILKFLGFPFDWIKVWEKCDYYDVTCLDSNGYTYIEKRKNECNIEFSEARNKYRLISDGFVNENSNFFISALSKLDEYNNITNMK